MITRSLPRPADRETTSCRAARASTYQCWCTRSSYAGHANVKMRLMVPHPGSGRRKDDLDPAVLPIWQVVEPAWSLRGLRRVHARGDERRAAERQEFLACG